MSRTFGKTSSHLVGMFISDFQRHESPNSDIRSPKGMGWLYTKLRKYLQKIKLQIFVLFPLCDWFMWKKSMSRFISFHCMIYISRYVHINKIHLQNCTKSNYVAISPGFGLILGPVLDLYLLEKSMNPWRTWKTKRFGSLSWWVDGRW